MPAEPTAYTTTQSTGVPHPAVRNPQTNCFVYETDIAASTGTLSLTLPTTISGSETEGSTNVGCFIVAAHYADHTIEAVMLFTAGDLSVAGGNVGFVTTNASTADGTASKLNVDCTADGVMTVDNNIATAIERLYITRLF